MDQKKTGAFIARRRRGANMTQRELADRLGISDKTVSKWERGGGMPEVSLMRPLCGELGISLNELFSGAELSGEEYRRRADENLLGLLKDVEKMRRNIVGGESMGPVREAPASADEICGINAAFWDGIGNESLGPISLPKWASHLPDEGKLRLLGDLSGKKVMEIACGTGISLKYAADNGAAEVWGIDISERQIERAREFLEGENIPARLICAPMEAEAGLPEGYFDVVFSVYGVGWTCDMASAFRNVFRSLTPGGIFAFSWSHPIHKCTAMENGGWAFVNPYFDESPYEAQVGGESIVLSSRMLGTWINALAECGFRVERVVETPDDDLPWGDTFAEKARMIPTAFAIRAVKPK